MARPSSSFLSHLSSRGTKYHTTPVPGQSSDLIRQQPAQPELVHDWNTHSGPEIPPGRRIMVNDETLRDGLQGPSVRDPSLSEKFKILRRMEAIGIDQVNVGLPGAGPRAFADAEALAREIIGSRMKMRINFGGRTHK